MPLKLFRVFLCAILMLPILSQNTLTAQNAPEIKLKTVVIDAGHGGHDPGAVSPDRKMQEKKINLDVALKLGKLINEKYPDVKVIYTRSKDVFISLNERTNIANRNHADLFISIHVNSARSTKANGTEVFVMGTDKNASNMEVSKRENSVILLEDDYSTTYQGFDPNVPESYIFFNLMQNAFFEQSIVMASFVNDNLKKGPIVNSRGIKQAPLLVLWRTTMPSVLIEIGFISSAADRKFLGNESSIEETSKRIFNAFEQFKIQYETGEQNPVLPAEAAPSKEEAKSSESVKPSEEVKSAEGVKPSEGSKSAEEVQFTIQLLATKNQIKNNAPDLKGTADIDVYFSNGFYKYCTGRYSTRDAASKALIEVKKTFPQAFVVDVDKLGEKL